ncbi:hypothetical protein WSS_A37574 [Rhodococcus opacus M213]|uniref:Uncharacterized protein n=1 Tax=Rhodococcus opacus M213 TaxID=1129896 RepID=K8X7A0_RHOOP|nr:hypothetical protein WSS_A37574 [Rhodococcus opacus M213]
MVVEISDVIPNPIAAFEVASARCSSRLTTTAEMTRCAISGLGMSWIPHQVSRRVISSDSAV